MFICSNIFSKAKKIFFLLALFPCFINSQIVIPNHVNNGSFEDKYFCPTTRYQVFNVNTLLTPASYPASVKNWFSPNLTGSPDYFNSCSTNTEVSLPINYFGNCNPRTGDGIVGGAIYFDVNEARENIETSLKSTLQNNKTYCVTFYVRLAEYSRYAINSIGAYFSNDSLKNYWPYTAPPYIIKSPDVINNPNNIISDTINWTKVQSIYISNGTENFIMLGSMDSSNAINKLQMKPLFPNTMAGENAAYYYFDDVSVVEIKPAKAASHDTILVCPNTTFTLGTDSAWDATYSWQPPIGLSCTNCPNPVITATNNIKYYLSKEQCSSITKDSVVIKIYNDAVSIFPINNYTICAGNTTTLSTDSNSFFSYNWQPTVGLNCNNCALPLASPSVATTYTLTKSACGISNTANFNVSIKPNFTLTPQITLTNSVNCLFDTLNFLIINPPICNDLNYEWQPQSTIVLSFTNTASALIQNNSYYYVSINNSNNGIYCPFVKKDSIYISLPDTCTKPLVIPSIFTPNYDNVNDVWEFTIPYGAKLNAVYVYNRWGALIYTINESILHSNNTKIKTVYWDGHTTSGEQCADGIYFYIVEFEVNGNKKTLKGNVTLIR